MALKNFAYSLVATAPSPANSGTSLAVTAGQGVLFPVTPFYAVIWPTASQPLSTNAEIVQVTNVSSDTLTIVRTQEGTAARSVVVGDQIMFALTAQTFADLTTPSALGVPAGSGTSTGTNTGDQVNITGNAATVTTNANLTGDVTSAGNAATIAANAVTNAKAAQMAAHTFKGNNTGALANASDLTATQLTAEMNTMVGDSGSGGTKGLVPAPAAGDATKFLTGAGTWAAILAGTVTATGGSLTSNAIVLGAGGTDTKVVAGLTADGTTGEVIHTRSAAAANTHMTGLTLINTTAATTGNQQYSPSIILQGQGLKTSGSTSQEVDFRIAVVPTQASANPTGTLSIAAQVAGGGYVTQLQVGTGGGGGAITANSGGTYGWNTRSLMASSADGLIELKNNAGTAFTRLNFGGTTSSFVSLQSSGTGLTVGTADGGTGAGDLAVSGKLTAASTIELGHASDTTLSRSSAGVIAVEGVVVPTISSTNTLTNKTLTDAVNNISAPGTTTVGYLGVPANSQSAAYTTVMADAGKSIDHPSTDANARTFTIDSNANVAYPVGTCLTFTNMTANNVTIAIASDTMYLAGTGTTGSRTLAQYGIATARKLTSTTWLISGTGLT